MSLCGALAGFSSGFVRRAVGYHVLAELAAIAAGVLLVVAYLANRRRVSPARQAGQSECAALIEQRPQRVRRPRTQPGGGEQLEVAVALPRRLDGVARRRGGRR